MNEDSAISQSSKFAVGCAFAILLGAFLLFQVQPIISKIILPWFGGSPAVWTTCMLFFQVLLLGGYFYAYRLSRLRNAFHQSVIHLCLLGLAIFVLPITPAASWKPPDGQLPAWRILVLLTVNLGLPYLLLAATSPLIQFWFARAYPSRSPYRLYALSNIGSLAALLSYPFLIEPAMSTRVQDYVWSIAFAVFVVSCAYLVLSLRKSADSILIAKSELAGTSQQSETRLSRIACWLLLPAIGSVMLLAITNHLCLNISVVPLFWVAPLSIYLLTFIICFDHSRWYHRQFFAGATIVIVLFTVYLALYREINNFVWDWTGWSAPFEPLKSNTWFTAFSYLAALFCICMICHGELVHRKPPASQLTTFYLYVATGGALGGVFVAVICPLVFPAYLELPLTTIVAFVIASAILSNWLRSTFVYRYRWLVAMGSLLMLAVFAVVTYGLLFNEIRANVATARNFYGVISIWEHDRQDEQLHGRSMYHGNTMHGFQFLTPAKQQTATTYYAVETGVALAILDKQDQGPVHLGVVGLGTGTLASYGKDGDRIRIYEINPLVVELTEEYFTFLKDCEADVEVVSGDARLSMEREEPNGFDVLVLDAFSSDAVPAHLLTVEAMEIYRKHLKPDGILAIHTSNRYLNLGVVVVSLAEEFEMAKVRISYNEKEDTRAEASSHWYLLASDPQHLESKRIKEKAQQPGIEKPVLWTDQYNNLFQIIR